MDLTIGEERRSATCAASTQTPHVMVIGRFDRNKIHLKVFAV